MSFINNKTAKTISLFSGTMAIGIAFGVEIFGLGYPGYGPGQIALTLAGAVLLLVGLAMDRSSIFYRLFDTSASISKRDVLLVAICFGAFAGLAEDAVVVSRSLLMHKSFISNPHWHWMKPVVNALLFSVLMIPVFLMPARRKISFRVITFVLSIAFFISVLFVFPGIHKIASVVLALGFSVRLSGWMQTHATSVRKNVTRALPVVFSITLLIGGGVFLWKKIPEMRMLSRLSESKEGAPNVLLIVLDTVRASSLSLYGYGRNTTPEIDKLAANGVTFEEAYATAPWTLPSHATIFTGLYPQDLFNEKVTPLNGFVPLTADVKRLPEIFSEQGYATAGFVANLLYCGFAYGITRGFAHYEDYEATRDWFLSSSVLSGLLYASFREATGNAQSPGRKSAGEIRKAFSNWLDAQDERPFFVFLNINDAHDPYLPPGGFSQYFGELPADPKLKVSRRYEEHELVPLRDAYDSCLAYMDNEVGLIIKDLEARGILENTIIIITADHGEQFGEHDLVFHANSLYRSLLHVPLIMYYPAKLPQGLRVTTPVTLRNLASTALDIAGFDSNKIPGNSLAGLWDAEDSVKPGIPKFQLSQILIGDEAPKWGASFWPFHKGPMQSLVKGSLHYIRNGDGSEELYDIRTDPEEMKNLASRKNWENSMLEFRNELDQFLSGRKDSHPKKNEVLDEKTPAVAENSAGLSH